MEWLGGIVMKTKVEGGVVSFPVYMSFEMGFAVLDVVFVMWGCCGIDTSFDVSNISM
jgi:hypothetical protein